MIPLFIDVPLLALLSPRAASIPLDGAVFMVAQGSNLSRRNEARAKKLERAKLVLTFDRAKREGTNTAV